MNSGFVNPRYKTKLCTNWETYGTCQMEAKCHFAHGKDELRSMGDASQIPMMSAPIEKKSFQNNGQGNFKTVKCRFFENGGCKYGENCTFAHGDSELRPFTSSSGGNNGYSQMSQPMNSYQSMGYMQNNNYGPDFMTDYNNKIIMNQLKMIIMSLMQVRKEDVDFQIKLKKAAISLNGNDVEACKQVLNALLTDPLNTPEMKLYFQNVVMEAQNLPQMMGSFGGDFSQNEFSY